MKPKLRILTYHHIQNVGAFLFAYTLLHHFKNNFKSFDVKILDYKSIRLGLYEYLKRYRLFPGAPFFYYKRSKLWASFLDEELDLDKAFPKFTGFKRKQIYFGDCYDAIIVGMDVWCLTKGMDRPSFPNLYWLPEKTSLPKIAYAVSGFNSDASRIERNATALEKYLNDFAVIGARDRFTYEMVMKNRTRPDGVVEMIPDPAFLYEIKSTGVKKKLGDLGIDFNRPILCLLVYGNPELSNEIVRHFHAKGYQTLALSMYNPFADVNAGNVLTPHEWAEVFGYGTFCITDRFHGTVFCLKNEIPFICIEKDHHLPQSQSKLHNLLTDFHLEMSYFNPADPNFETTKLLNRVDDIIKVWDDEFRISVRQKIKNIGDQHNYFIEKIRKTILEYN